MQKNKIILFETILILVLLMLIGTAWVTINTPQKNINQVLTENNEENKNDNGAKLFDFNLTKPAFASFNSTQENVIPHVPVYRIVAKDISNLDSFKNDSIELNADQLKALEDSGFFLSEKYATGQEWPGYDDFVDLYNHFQGSSNEYLREPQNTLFVTSDVGMHLFHVLIDRSFQKTEETKFQPLLLSITKALFKDSLEKFESASDESLKASYKRLAVFYLIPLATLESAKGKVALNPNDFETYAKYVEANDKQEAEAATGEFKIALSKNIDGIAINDAIYDLATQEIALINKAEGTAPSPLFTPLRPELINDYSQFKPRSHYTKNEILKSYFIAMMWYGRMGFTLNSPDLTRDTIIITGQVNSLNAGDKKISRLWSDMSSAIEFFVGETDDLTPYQYTEEIKKTYGNSMTADQLADDSLLNKFINAVVKDLPSPRILSEAIAMKDIDSQTKEELLKNTMQFRFMGQRFTPDAEIYTRLTQGDEAPDPETGQKLPSIPTSLMIASLLNPQNQTTKAYLDEWVNNKDRINTEGRESDKIIKKVYAQIAEEFSGYDNAVWTQNIYWGWLNSLRALTANYGTGFPAFMTGADWQKKNLGTMLGSYTELKHDTLLYAKQSYAERGGGGPDVPLPPAVKGYVEPDVVFWDRLTALTTATRDGLKERNVMPDEYAPRYDALIDALTFLRRIAAEELNNQTISDEDFEKLRTISGLSFERIVEPLPGEELTLRERRAGLIADIHTDARLGRILYEATGKPYVIYVAVKDANGTRLTRGVVYNHYELTGTLDKRLNDEEWQATAYSDSNKTVPDKWSQELVK
jgi:hypothetical protein